MSLKPWYTLVTPREDLIEGKPLDASEFAVHLDHVRTGTAPKDYTDAERFFHRTYLTRTLLDMASQTVRRFAGITTETSPVFNLTTQFGGGKTHSLTLLYHLAREGKNARRFHGVDEILRRAGIDEIPTAKTFVFVGTEFSSVTGRGGEGEPLRKTPWGELAWQIGGEEGFAQFARLDDQFIPPAGDDLQKLFDPDQPYLLLFDEVLNYVSKHRKFHNLAAQFYNFIHTLTEFVRSRNNIVMAVSIPASELEMSAEDQTDYDRLKKLLDRLGKAMMMAAEHETKNIIRRRLFDWHGLPVEARKTISEYIFWIEEHKSQLNFNLDTARQEFEEAYPFHPAVLSLFERKWQTLPRFQQTRGILRLLALWVARAYTDGYKKRTGEALISLGSAPLDDPNFRAAVFEQLGENRLEAAVATDIAGREDSHAVRLDQEAIEAIKKAHLHRKVATIIFFESNGGQTREGLATLPEIKLSVGEPGLDIGLVDNVLQSLLDNCYYLTSSNNKFRFSIHENLIKRFTDRRASVSTADVEKLVEQTVRSVFDKGKDFEKVLFPERSNQVVDRPVVILVVLHPSRRIKDAETMSFLEDLVNNYGASSRIFKSGLIFSVCEDDVSLKEEAKKYLAWQSIYEEREELNLQEEQVRQVKVNMTRAKKDLEENVWKSYKNLVYLDRNNQLFVNDLGLIHSSQARTITELYKNRLEIDGEITLEVSPNFLIRNWPPALTAWSTKGVRDAFYQTPRFPRLLNHESLKRTISNGVENGFLAYVGKQGNKFEPFFFNQTLNPHDIEISDEMFIIKAEEARKHIEPRKLSSLKIIPPELTLEPGKSYAFAIKGYDQYGDEIEVGDVEWQTTNGTITQSGQLTVNEIEGIYQISATVSGVKGHAMVRVSKSQQGQAEPTPDSLPDKSSMKKISWSGEINPKKWNVFYTKVLARFANNPTLRIKISFEVEEEASNADQKKEETKSSLKELGLNTDI